jgi:hypothetical protein
MGALQLTYKPNLKIVHRTGELMRSHEAKSVQLWLSTDPLAEVQPNKTPYHYCSNNPVSRTDPTGMIDGEFRNEKGQVVGNDGIDDGKVYVIKTSEKSFPTGQTQDTPSAGISRKDAKATEEFIKTNSGNTSAFQSNDIAYKNSVEIEGTATTRQSMVDIVGQDNGKGGTDGANNREYGGRIKRDGTVVEAPAGRVGDPINDTNVSISLTTFFEGQVTFHSHPSGVRVDGNTTGSWAQAPSYIGGDVKNSNNTREYVFGRGNGTVYIYNSTGVMATIPQQYFVTGKK